jgi:HEPN domain-containing protein
MEFARCRKIPTFEGYLNMTKQKHIDHWLNSAEKDWEIMEYLLKGKKYVHALFFGHLYLEKLAKALWVKNRDENIPPKIHNLLKLLKEGDIELIQEQQMFLLKLNQYQIEGRYPEDIDKLYKFTNSKIATEYLNEIKKLKKCFLKMMQ